MKKSLIFGIFVFLVLISFVSAVEFPLPTCYENDDGLDYGVRGVTVDEKGFYNDSCSTNIILREFYCIEGNASYIDVECTDGCVEDACVNGSIVKPECESDEDCGQGKECIDGKCVIKEEEPGNGGGGGGGGGDDEDGIAGPCVTVGCDYYGAECGLWYAGCGENIDCGNCSEDEFCLDGRCIYFSMMDGKDMSGVGEDSAFDVFEELNKNKLMFYGLVFLFIIIVLAGAGIGIWYLLKTGIIGNGKKVSNKSAGNVAFNRGGEGNFGGGGLTSSGVGV